MTTGEYAKKLGLEIVCEGGQREVSGCYIGDLLSWVMSKANVGQAWITVMSNTNVAAVASMTDCACVVLCEGARPDDALTERAQKLGLPLFCSYKPAYELACLTCEALKNRA